MMSVVTFHSSTIDSKLFGGWHLRLKQSRCSHFITIHIVYELKTYNEPKVDEVVNVGGNNLLLVGVFYIFPLINHFIMSNNIYVT